MKHLILSFLALTTLFSCAQSQDKQIEVALITGHTDKHHNWELMSEHICKTLAQNPRFNTLVIEVNAVDEETINFSEFDVVIMNINEVTWCEEAKGNFESYMAAGGGLVVVHEANNAFPEWKAYNEMIGLGGWGGRSGIESGPYFYYLDGEFVTDSLTAGAGGAHGRRVPFEITLRDSKHPITKRLPSTWSHTNDELYGNLRGPAKNIHPLATAFSSSQSGGTGKEEVVLFTIDYHKGRIFHTVLGHTGKEFDESLKNPGFDITLLRGTEWAATGEVNFEANFNLIQ